jgi:hypothetical protein
VRIAGRFGQLIGVSPAEVLSADPNKSHCGHDRGEPEQVNCSKDLCNYNGASNKKDNLGEASNNAAPVWEQAFPPYMGCSADG